MKLSKTLLTLLLFDLFLFAIYFGLKIYLEPVAIIVPHHNIVKEKRLEYFQKIKSKRPLTQKIIIIGPDHFSPQQISLSYSNLYSKSLESQFKSLTTLQNGLIQNDHAVYNLLPDIKLIWPQAQIFPILIGQNYPVSGLDNLIKKLNQICSFNCLLISSVDFSHYLPATLANIHDQKSIYDLSNQNLTEIPKLEVDSPQSLYIMANYSNQKNAYNWDLFYHSNSGELVNNPDVETTSHIFGSYQTSFRKNYIPETKTYLISKNIDKKKSLNSLGNRFFYGTDFIDLNYSSKSSLILPFELPKDTVLSVVVVNNKPTYTFFPTEIKNGATYFLRGEAKTKKLDSILKNINNAKI